MRTVQDILDALEEIAPSRYALSFDKIGLQVGERSAKVSRAVVSLDRSLEAVSFAASSGAQALLAHHPLIFEPLSSITADEHVGRTVLKLISEGISFVAAHTNWDAAPGGINDTLAELLRLRDVQPFGMAARSKQLKMTVFTPAQAVDGVIDAASAAGAGEIGLYSRCAFSSFGTGTFCGGEGSGPTVGSAGRVEKVEETRVEMVAPEALRSAVDSAVRGAHPYEEPAIDWFVLADGGEHPLGRIGELASPMSLADFVVFVDSKLETRSLAWGSSKTVRRVAVVGGAADSEWVAAQRAGADVLVTGEVKQHVALEAAESGFAVMASGHYATEHPGCAVLAARMREALPEVEWEVFVPERGRAGRPL